MLFVIPALWALFFGIVGIPTSWPLLLESTLDLFAGDRGPLGTLVGIISTLYKCIIFLPFACPPFLDKLPPAIKWLIFREPEKMFEPPDAQKTNAIVKNEFWIFVNGVATTSEIAFANQNELYKMFSRPITLCHNPTDGVVFDLLECAAGKVSFFDWFWEPAPRFMLAEAVRKALYDAPKKYTRVVLICHSQGTIITSNMLTKVPNMNDARTKELMKKYLEVYAFADCAHQMPDLNLKYLENISNGRDSVAWLGALFPFKSFWQDTNGRGIEIGGSFVTEPYLWGHLLNTHYLYHLQNNKYRGSRLQAFRNGRVPPPQNAVVSSMPEKKKLQSSLTR
jgi:hypothetical protein